MAKARLDQTGKVYIPRGIRKAVGIKEGDLFDVEVQGSSVVLSRSRLRIARQGKGQFKLKRRIKYVDKGIERLSTIVGAGGAWRDTSTLTSRVLRELAGRAFHRILCLTSGRMSWRVVAN